jgi:hypothetical protein
MGRFIHPAEQFSTIAARIRNEPHARDAIADGFELIADSIREAQTLVDDAMSECQECGQPEPLDAPAAPVIDALDLPDLGTDTTTTGQAE